MEVESHSIYLFNTLYNNINNDSLSGIFFGGLFGDCMNIPPITVRNNSGEYEIIDRILPSKESFTIEVPYINCFPYNPFLLEKKLGHLISTWIGICDYTIIGTRYDPEGNVFSTLICGFNGLDTLRGFLAYFSASNIFPAEMVILGKFDSTLQLINVEMSIKFPIDPILGFEENTREYNHWASPPVIIIQSKIYSDLGPVKLESLNPKGWLISDLREEINKRFGFLPSNLIFNEVVDGVYNYYIDHID